MRYLKLISIIYVSFLISCQLNAHKKKIEQNAIIYHNTSKLSKLISLEKYKPNHVDFTYTSNDLEAILFFDSLTFSNLNNFYNVLHYASPNYQLKDFEFEWMDDEIKNALEFTDTSYHGTKDYIFSPRSESKLWFVDLAHAILLKKKVTLKGN